MGAIQAGFRRLAGDALGAEIDQHQMAVRAAGDDVEALLNQCFGQYLGIFDHGLLIGAEVRAQCLAKCNGLGGDDMHQWTALQAGEHGAVDLAADVRVVRQDHTAARAAQRLVGGGGSDVGVRQRAGEQISGDQAGEMRHVHHEVCAHLIGDPANAREVDDARICGATGDDEFWLLGTGKVLEFFVVQHAIVAPHAVLHGPEPLARQVGGCAVGQMAASSEAHAQDGVAGSQQGQKDSLVGLGARVGLHIGELAGEQTFRPIDRQVLRHIDLDAAAVIAAAGIALGVFVGEHRALGFQHRSRDDVLAGDQFDTVLLADQLGTEHLGKFRVGLCERGAEESLQAGGRTLFVHAEPTGW